MPNCLNCGHQSDAAFKFCPSCGTEAVTSSAPGDPFLGKILNNKYRILELVGTGAMGKVYRAEHTSLKKIVAIKLLHDDLMVNDESVQRFQGEGIAAGKFTHPNAIQIFDFDKDEEGNWFLAMEFVEGQSIKQLLADKGGVGCGTAVDLMVQVLEALAEAHRQGIIHRDLKPDNIMVLENSSGALSVKVLDFGLSKLVDVAAGSAMLTQTGRILGTPRYMAPEQWGGSDVDLRIDIYAAGLVLYELLTGEAPFSSSTIQDAMLQSAQAPVPSLADSDFDIQVPAGIDEVLAAALAKDREDRYSSAEEMREDLLALDFEKLAGRRRSVTATRSRSGRRPKSAEPADGRRSPLLAIGGGVLVLVVAVWYLLGGMGGGTVHARVSEIPAAERSEVQNSYVAALERARSGLRKNELSDALKAAGDACHMECVDAEAFLVRALVYRAQADDDAARLDLDEAIKRDPRFAEAVAELAWMDFDAGRLEAAGQRFGEALAVQAGLPSALVGQAMLAFGRGEPAVASKLLAGVDRSIDSAALQRRMGQMFLGIDGAGQSAVDAFTRAKRNANFDARIHDGLGRAYQQIGQLDKARDAYLAALELDHEALPTRAALARLHVQQEQWPEALQITRAGLKRQSDHKPLLLLQGLALHGSGRDAEAIAALAKGVGEGAGSARLLLGILYQSQDRYAEAIACFTAVQAEMPGQILPVLNHGLCLLAQEDYEAAGAKLKEAASLDEGHAYAQLCYGIVAMEYLGDHQAALTALENYQALGGEDPRVKGWMTRLRQTLGK